MSMNDPFAAKAIAESSQDAFGAPLAPAEAMSRVRISFLRKTYAYFLLGLIVTGVGGVFALAVPSVLMFVIQHIYIALIVQFGLILAASVFINRRPWDTLFYLLFTFATGIILTPILLAVTMQTGSPAVVVQAFGITTSIFVGLSLYALFTKRDFSFLRGGLMIALFTLIGLGLVNLFIKSDALSLFFASLAAVLFSGFILYDTNRMVKLAGRISPVSAALNLYLDFYNLFLAILRLLGRRR